MQDHEKPCWGREGALSEKCKAVECYRCGWNPAVERKRRLEIHELAGDGKLIEWGKVKTAPMPKPKAMAVLDLVEHFKHSDLRVWLWWPDGTVCFNGSKIEAVKEFGALLVADWTINGAMLQVDVCRGD